jgi:ATP-dependent DNA ligase
VADYCIMKAVDYSALPAKYRKANPILGPDKFWLQRKYDGCFAMVYMCDDLADCRVQSRTGETCLSMGHIIKELYERCSEYGPFEPVWILGEAWRPPHEALFPEISGQFRRHNPEPSLRFIVNDIVPAGLNTTRPYHERFQDLLHLLPADPFASCQVAETYFCHEWHGTALDYALKWKAQGGFDGAIQRDPNKGYTVGRVKEGEIVKVKPTLSLDLRCTSTKQAPGEKTGRMVLTLEVEYKGVKSDVGSGVPHSLAASAVVGQIVEVECMGVTEEGRLREPRFKGVRYDKTEAD